MAAQAHVVRLAETARRGARAGRPFVRDGGYLVVIRPVQREPHFRGCVLRNMSRPAIRSYAHRAVVCRRP